MLGENQFESASMEIFGTWPQSWSNGTLSLYMEKMRLPVMNGSENPFRKQEQKESKHEMVVEKIASAFLRQRYPLSPAGEEFKARLKTVVDNKDSEGLENLKEALPTVERPHLEYFRDLEINEKEENEIFGGQLSNIQVSKGCRHRCDFCAAGAAARVEMMPFAAVLKIAEKKRSIDEKIEKGWVSWAQDINQGTGFDVTDEAKFEDIAWGDVSSFVEKNYKDHPLSQILPPELFGWGGGPQNRGDLEGGQIQNYYDSDPFDYKDATFLHSDGTPAHYGDVFAALATDLRPIHITTAGWPLEDKHAQRAAEKIRALVKMNPGISKTPRISVNPYEATAKKDLSAYQRMMRATIHSLEDLSPEVLLFNDRENPKYQKEVVEPLLEEFKDKLRVSEPRTSFYSGPMKNEVSAEDHHDVMTCMAGTHIWPDGTVAQQYKKYSFHETRYAGDDERAVPKGSRPRSVGKKLF